MIPSKFQQEIFKEFRQTNNNIIINVVPGSGKTTTLLELFKLTPKFHKSIFLAFNKVIVEELETKIPQHVQISTLHSFGLKILNYKWGGKLKVKENKINYLFSIYSKTKKLNLTPNQIYKVYKSMDVMRLFLVETGKDLIEKGRRFGLEYDKNDLKIVLGFWKYLCEYNVKGTIISRRKICGFY